MYSIRYQHFICKILLDNNLSMIYTLQKKTTQDFDSEKRILFTLVLFALALVLCQNFVSAGLKPIFLHDFPYVFTYVLSKKMIFFNQKKSFAYFFATNY